MNEDKIIKILMRHEERLDRIEENMATKEDLHQITNTLDVLVKLANKKDQELAALSYNQKLMRNDIDKIKPLVGLT